MGRTEPLAREAELALSPQDRLIIRTNLTYAESHQSQNAIKLRPRASSCNRYGLSRASLYAPPDLPHIENWVQTNELRAREKASFGSLELWTQVEKSRGKPELKTWKKSDNEIREEEKQIQTEESAIENNESTKSNNSM